VNFYQTGLVLETGCKPGCPWGWGCSPSKTGFKCNAKQALGKGIEPSFGEIKELHSNLVYCRTAQICRRSEKHV